MRKVGLLNSISELESQNHTLVAENKRLREELGLLANIPPNEWLIIIATGKYVGEAFADCVERNSGTICGTVAP